MEPFSSYKMGGCLKNSIIQNIFYQVFSCEIYDILKTAILLKILRTAFTELNPILSDT